MNRFAIVSTKRTSGDIVSIQKALLNKLYWLVEFSNYVGN